MTTTAELFAAKLNGTLTSGLADGEIDWAARERAEAIEQEMRRHPLYSNASRWVRYTDIGTYSNLHLFRDGSSLRLCPRPADEAGWHWVASTETVYDFGWPDRHSHPTVSYEGGRWVRYECSSPVPCAQPANIPNEHYPEEAPYDAPRAVGT